MQRHCPRFDSPLCDCLINPVIIVQLPNGTSYNRLEGNLFPFQKLSRNVLAYHKYERVDLPPVRGALISQQPGTAERIVN